MKPHDEIRKAREAAGLTQTDLADMAGMQRSNLNRDESGRVDIPVSRFVKLLDLCGFALRVVKKRKDR